MSAIETIKMKLETGEYVFRDTSVYLEYDPRHGCHMPFLRHGSEFLEDARAKASSLPPPEHVSQARDRAKRLMLTLFWWACPDHGRTVFHTHTGKCAMCFRDGKRHVGVARAAARDAGEPTYADSCIIHGQVPFSTARGLCLSCYNTLGQPRPLSTNPEGYYVNRDGGIKEAL